MDSDIAKKQATLINNLEGMGDILEYQARRKRNKPVLQGLKRIKDIHNLLFDIKNKDPKRFEKLLLSQKYFDMYEKNKDAAQFEVAFRPKEHLVAFYATINQFIRIYEAAISVGNEEVSAQAIYYLIGILKDLSSKPDNGQFIQQILDQLYSLYDGGKAKRKTYTDNALAYEWYTFTVGGLKDDFRPEYLSAFNQAFLFSIMRIVQDNDSKMYERMLGSLVNSSFNYYNVSVWSLDDVLMENDFQTYRRLTDEQNVRDITNALENQIVRIRTYDQLVQWDKDLDNLINIFKPHITRAIDKKKFNKSVQEVKKRAIAFYKQNALTDLFFDIASRCLYYKGYKFIYDLWEYNQPSDATATWGNQNLYLAQPDQLVNYYFRNLDTREFTVSWPGHHGNEHYYKRYFLLLFARVLTRNPAVQINLSIDDVSTLQSITFAVPELIGIALTLSNDEHILSELQLSQSIFEQQVQPKLKSILDNANSKLDQIELTKELTDKKVEKFKEDTNKGYEGAEVFAAIFKDFGLYDENQNESAQSSIRRLNGLPRSAFIAGWNVYYGNVATDFGQQTAIEKNEAIFSEMVAKSTVGTMANIEPDSLNELEKPIILIYGVPALMYFRQNTEPLTREELDEHPDDVRYIGWYHYDDKKIPVMQLPRNDRSQSACILIDMGSESTIGKYTQNMDFTLTFHDLSKEPDMLESSFQPNSSDDEREKLKREVLIEATEAFSLHLSDTPTIIKIDMV